MERLLTIEDVAELLQMSPRFVEQEIRMIYIDIIQIGNETRIEASAYRRYIENRNAAIPIVGRQRLRGME